MRPTVGRTVHYRSYGSPGGEYTSQCRAAIITEVADPGVVDADLVNVGLAVLNPEGMFFNRNVRQSEEGREGGTWHWPAKV